MAFQDIFIIALVLTSTSFFQVTDAKLIDNFKNECNNFFYENSPPLGLPYNNAAPYQPICQDYKNAFHFATLYDTDNRIAVYSAYKLEDVNGPSRPRRNWRIDPDIPADKQARDNDYTGSGYDRGHLNPKSYNSGDGQDSTFTLTNAVPQEPTFHNPAWTKMETDVKTFMETQCPNEDRYFITGAIPGNILINNRVTVPSHMWTAACCSTSGKTFAYRGSNTANSRVTECSIIQLEAFLNNEYPNRNQDVFIFGKNGCVKKGILTRIYNYFWNRG